MAAALMGEAFLSAFLQEAFDRMASFDIVDYLKGRKLINRLVQKLKIVMISADAVLTDAEEKQFTNPAVKMWLDELKDAVYVADDLLDEIFSEALRCKLEAESANTSKVRGFLFTFVNSFDKRIQSELENILDRLEYIVKQKDALDLIIVSGVLSRPRAVSCPKEYGVFGRERDMEAIFEKFQSDDSSVNGICVAPIVGMGGIGKTTLAQLIYNDRRVKESFDLKAWVCVSENFDNFEIAKTIFEEITLSACEIPNLNLLQTRIRETFMEKKIFLVLDDVWNENHCDWVDLLKVFGCGAQEIKIIVTTRSCQVASIVSTVPTYCLEQLSDKECWLLFKKHAFKNGSSSEFEILEDIGRQIVQKCRGSPLAAKALGGLLWFEEDPREWIKILKSNLWDLSEASSIFPALRLSYYYLPSHLKRCFAYCSILRKNYEFKKEELVLLWMAEDLLQQSKGNLGMEDIGEQYFDDLVSRSFFQPSSKNNSYFVMHDLVNDLATFISGGCCVRLEENDETNEITKKTRHLLYYKSAFHDNMKFEILDGAQGLRTLLGYNMVKIADLLKCKFLRVLLLSSMNLRELPESVGNLTHLRYLNIQGTKIEHLPDSLCNLYNLQTLILSKHISDLPIDIGSLINLRHLEILGTKLKEMPPQMSKLKNLRKLSIFVVSKHGGSCSIRELGTLQYLSGKLSISSLENVHCIEDATEAMLKNKQHLSELELKWEGGRNAESETERNVLEQLCPHTNLNSLTIKHYEGTRFPNWIGDCSFYNMNSIELKNCKYCFNLPPFGQLPALKELKIEGFDAVLLVSLEFYGNGSFPISKPFKSLEYLSFKDMPEWQEWVIDEVFFSLRELCISDCPKLSWNLPIHLPSLNKLEIIGCKKLVASLPRAPALCELQWDGKIVQLPSGPSYPSLERMTIFGGYDSLWLFPLDLFPNLKSVGMYECENLESLSTSVGSHPDPTSFTSLIIMGYPNFTSIPSGGLCALKLTEMKVNDCKRLKSLPEGMHTLLPSLLTLELAYCPELESFPEGGLPSNLKTLEIKYCEKLISHHMEWGLQGLHSLRKFVIRSKSKEMESFSREALLPSTLTHSGISYFPKLEPPKGQVPSTLLIKESLETEESGESELETDADMEITFKTKGIKQEQKESNKEDPSHSRFFEGKSSMPLTQDDTESSSSRNQTSNISEEDDVLTNAWSNQDGGQEFSFESMKISEISELMELPMPVHSLKIERCDDLEFIPEELMASDLSLQHLYIINCCSLQCFPEDHPPTALKALYIRNCKKLDFPLTKEKKHQDALLEHLCIGSSCDSLKSLSLDLFPKLKSLSIWDCANLQSLSMPEGVQKDLTSLEALEIRDCPNLVSFPKGGLPTPNLTSIWLSNCKNLKELPDQLHTLNSLQSMFINNCPELVSLSKKDLPSNLSLLSITFCNKLKLGTEWGLDGLHYLSRLEIEGGCVNVESFPEENLLPSNLSSLRISKLLNLKYLDNKGLQHLTTLKTLEISCCDELQSLPEDGFPSSLSFLCIKECSLLTSKFRNKKGKDWSKIAHISCIEIDEEVIP